MGPFAEKGFSSRGFEVGGVSPPLVLTSQQASGKVTRGVVETRGFLGSARVWNLQLSLSRMISYSLVP